MAIDRESLPVDYVLTPRIVRAFFIVGLRRYFSNHPEYPCNDAERISAITIQEGYDEDARYENRIPAIIVESSGVRFNQEGIGNQMEMHKLNPYQAMHSLGCTINGDINITAIADSSIDSEELAWEIALWLMVAKNPVNSLTHMQFMGMPQLSAPTLSDKQGYNGSYSTTISFNYSFAVKLNWTPFDKGELLKEIGFYLDTYDPAASTNTGNTPNNVKTTDVWHDPNDPGNGIDHTDDPNNPGGNGGKAKNTIFPYDSDWIYLKFRITDGSITGTQYVTKADGDVTTT